MTEPRWQLVIAASAERQLDRLPEKIAAAVVEFMLGPLVDNPRRVGHRLQRELAGTWSARRGNYRIIYEIDNDENIILVLRIDHRADVYRPR
jgi:mRNA-degrading endonuclease RelE of RelBE toxin-antitoxin system